MFVVLSSIQFVVVPSMFLLFPLAICWFFACSDTISNGFYFCDFWKFLILGFVFLVIFLWIFSLFSLGVPSDVLVLSFLFLFHFLCLWLLPTVGCRSGEYVCIPWVLSLGPLRQGYPTLTAASDRLGLSPVSDVDVSFARSLYSLYFVVLLFRLSSFLRMLFSSSERWPIQVSPSHHSASSVATQKNWKP